MPYPADIAGSQRVYLADPTDGSLYKAGSAGGASAAPGSQEQDVRGTGTLNATSTSSTIVIPVNGQATVGLTISGLTASGAIVTFEQSNDGGTTYTGVNEVNAGTGVPSATRNTDGQTRVAVQGRTNLRLRVSTAGTGAINVAWNVSVREGLVTLASPLPPGTNSIGTVQSQPTGSTPLGYRQTASGDLAASTALPTVPSDATVAVVIPDGAGVRVRKDGTAPTATVGMPVPVGGSVTLYGAEIAAARFIQQAAGAILNIEYAK